MKKINGSNELKILIEGKAITVSQARFKLRFYLVQRSRLAEAIAQMQAIEKPTPEEQQRHEALVLKHQLNEERVRVHKEPLDTQFPQPVTATN